MNPSCAQMPDRSRVWVDNALAVLAPKTVAAGDLMKWVQWGNDFIAALRARRLKIVREIADSGILLHPYNSGRLDMIDEVLGGVVEEEAEPVGVV